MQIHGLSQESFLQATNTMMLKVACSAWVQIWYSEPYPTLEGFCYLRGCSEFLCTSFSLPVSRGACWTCWINQLRCEEMSGDPPENPNQYYA